MGTGIPQPMFCLGYGLDDLGFESHQEQAIFSLLQNCFWGPSSPLCNG